METQPGLYGYQPCTIQYVLLLKKLCGDSCRWWEARHSQHAAIVNIVYSPVTSLIPSGLEPDQMTSPLHHGAVVWVLCEPRLLTMAIVKDQSTSQQNLYDGM